jgi:hypothetical protein
MHRLRSRCMPPRTLQATLRSMSAETRIQVQAIRIMRSCCEHLHETRTEHGETLDLARNAAGYHGATREPQSGGETHLMLPPAASANMP